MPRATLSVWSFGREHYNLIKKLSEVGFFLDISTARCYTVQVEKRKKIFIAIKKATLCAFVLSMLAICLPVICGCSQKVGIDFSIDEITLYVGEVRDLFPYAVFSPATASEKSFSLSTESDALELSGTAVEAVAPGTAVVKAQTSGGAAEITVKSVYRPATVLDVEVSGRLVQNEANGEFDPINFSASVDENTDPSTVFAWYVNGEEYATGREITFEPAYGEYDVEVRAQSLSHSERVSAYRRSDAVGTAFGELEQHNDFSEVVFTVRETLDSRNPRSCVEWYVNGSVFSRSHTFGFTPHSAGEYAVELYVNGVKRDISGRESVTVTATGERAPVGSVVFDDADGVYIKWSDGDFARSVSITDTNGQRSIYYFTDSLYTGRFGRGLFDATDLIELFSDEHGEYTVRVTGDTQGAATSFTQLPMSAKPYVAEKVLVHNSYFTDADEAALWLYELYACGKQSGAALLSDESLSDGVMQSLVDAAEKLGLATAQFSMDGAVVTADLGAYINSPMTEGTESVSSRLVENLHIEYDETKRRPRSYVFDIDRREQKIAVSGSEQLLIVASSQFKPAPTKSSTAYVIYDRAKKILLDIIGSDYSDEQKVHAIADWLVWTTHTSSGAGNSVSNYLEGVFGGSGFSVSGEVSSEGAAKALLLMCAIEGIECKIVCEKSGENFYCYNRTKIDGLWYNVDVYGGRDVFDGVGYVSHRCTLVPDGAVFVDAQDGEAFDEERSYYLEKSFYRGVYTDRYIEAADVDAITVAVHSAFSQSKLGEITISAVGRKVTLINNDLGAELKVAPTLGEAEINDIAQKAASAAQSYGQYLSDSHIARVSVRISGSVIYISALVVTGAPQGS